MTDHDEVNPTDPGSATASLSDVAGLIASGDLREARKMLLAAQKLATAAPARIEQIFQRLAARERIAGPHAAFENAREREDWIAARDHARRAAQLAGSDDAAAFLLAVQECAARIRAEWRIGEAEVDIPAGDAVIEFAGELDAQPPPARLLTDGGAVLILVSVHDRWVFVREVDLGRRSIRRIGWLHTPESVAGFAPVQVDEDSIWLFGENGFVLQLSRRPLDVARWISIRPFMLPDRIVGDAFVAGRFAWCEIEDPGSDQRVAVIDLDEWRVCKRPDVDGFEPVAGTEPPRLLGIRYADDDSVLYDVRGERLDWAHGGHAVKSLVAHPNGRGWIALVAAGDEDGGPLGVVEMIEGRPTSEPLIVEGSADESPATLAVSREARLAFLLTHLGEGVRLFAYRSGLEHLEEAWSVEVSSATALVQDPLGRSTLAIGATPTGVDFAMLGRSAPSLRAVPRQELVMGSSWRMLQDVLPQRDHEELLLFEELARYRKSSEAERWSEKIRRAGRDDPAALARLADVLTGGGKRDLAERILTFALERHGHQARLLLARARLAAARREWIQAEAWLAQIDVSALEPPDLERLHHLWADARLRAGDAEAALRHFEESGTVEPSGRVASSDLELARALFEEPRSEPASAESAERRVVRACRLADAHRANGDHASARRELDVPAVHAVIERESAARLADAHLAHDPTTPWARFRKAVALARFVGLDARRAESIAGLGWSEEQIGHAMEKARAWLDAFHRIDASPVHAVPGWAAPVEPEGPATEEQAAPHPRTDPRAPRTHSLPPLGHESIRALVPGLDAAVRETVAYVRALPEWDETQTLGDDLSRSRADPAVPRVVSRARRGRR